jgi:flavin-dependent dehydrogenase
VIIGAGTAGLSAAETLRKSGYKGYIYLITQEKGNHPFILDLPYDRSLLSKGINTPPKPIRSEESLENNGIIVMR